MTTLFNAYRPKDTEIEYADVVEQERIEYVDSFYPSATEQYIDAFEALLPDECPVPYIPDVPEGKNTLLSDLELANWQGAFLREVVAPQLTKAAYDIYLLEIREWTEIMSGERSIDEADNYCDSAMWDAMKRKWNLTW